MFKRIVTSLIGLPLLLALVFAGGVYLRLGIVLLSLIGMHEFYQALSKKNLSVHFIGYLFCIFYNLLIEYGMSRGLYVSTSVFILCLLIYLVVSHQKTSIMDCAVTMFGFYYVSFLLSNIYLVREFNAYGKYFVWLIFICAWACDTGAYFTGITLGKHKLIPSLSPNKTIEGAVGGMLSSGLVAFLYGLIVSRFFVLQDMHIVLFFTLIGLAGGVLAQLGDLTASAIKRHTRIKDFGKILPGHGGVLDRFDSVLFTAPAVYLLMRVIFYIQQV